MKATCAYLCLYVAFVGVAAALMGVLLWAFFGGGADPIFSHRYPA